MIAPKEFFDDKRPRFQPGDLVIHKRYGYRGVVVAFDKQCEASDAWYTAKQTQPDRMQAWYHVLVDGSNHTTYAAESNLAPDQSGECILHPWVNDFFSSFEGTHYIRNDTPWPHGPPE